MKYVEDIIALNFKNGSKFNKKNRRKMTSTKWRTNLPIMTMYTEHPRRSNKTRNPNQKDKK